MSEVLERQRPRSATAKTKLVAICSPKGGVGKTTLASNFLVRAAQLGHRALGIDFDAQRTLSIWYGFRDQEQRAFTMHEGKLDRWSTISSELGLGAIDQSGDRAYDLVIIDMAPSVEDHILTVRNVIEDADLVLVPTRPASKDLWSVVPWGKTISKMGAKTAFILTQINRQATSWQAAQTELTKTRVGLCPVAIPVSEDVSRYEDRGLAVCDLTRARSDIIQRFEAAFDYVAKEIDL